MEATDLLSGVLVIWLSQGKCLDNPSRPSGNDKAMVGFTRRSLYESGSQSPLHNSATTVEKQFSHAALGRLPFVSPHHLWLRTLRRRFGVENDHVVLVGSREYCRAVVQTTFIELGHGAPRCPWRH